MKKKTATTGSKKMSQPTLLIGGAVALLLLLLVGAFLVKAFRNDADDDSQFPMNQMMEQRGQDLSESNPFKGGYQAAAALNVPMKCAYQVENHEYQGLIKGKQFRGEIKMENGQMGYVVMKDNCLYTWSDELKGQGFKMCDLDESDSMMAADDQAETDDSPAQAPANLPNNLTCYPAAISDSEFDLPSDVEFMDFGDMMQGMGQMPAQMMR